SGELEITFIKSYCRAANLAAIVQDDKVPGSLKDYVTKLKSLYDPKEPVSKRLSNSKMDPIPKDVLEMLETCLNCQEDQEYQWMIPDKLCLLPDEEAMAYVAVQPQAFFRNRVIHNGVAYSKFGASQEDSFVVFKKGQTGKECFGRIFSIFTHRQSPKQGQNKFVTWLHIQRFQPIPKKFEKSNPFHHIQAPDVQAHLYAWGSTEDQLVQLDDIIAHCTWMMYRPGEIRGIDIPTVALLSMVR
ncbi:hypothetical protein DFH28DRAFT_903892, partial [Melampsora americana]